MERLTDEQVATLAKDASWVPGTLETERCDPVVRALAVEVQAGRARRCDWCAVWARLVEDATQGECPRMGVQTSAEWFCADFTAKG